MEVKKMERKELKINVMPTENLTNKRLDKTTLKECLKILSEARKKQELLEEEKLPKN